MLNSRNTSWLGKLPAAVKFSALLIASIGLYFIGSWQVLAVLAAVAGLILLTSKASLKLVRWPLAMLGVVLAVVFVLLGLQTGWNAAGVSVLRLLAMCLLAYAVSLTTSFDAMLEFFQKAASPLRHLGANPQQIALALSMAIRFIPELRRVYNEVREAQLARGLNNNPLAVSVPLVIRSLKIADDTAQALDARGYDSSER